MFDFHIMGKTVSITGSGAESDPFMVIGTGYNPALAAEVETRFVAMLYEDSVWEITGTRLVCKDPGRTLAVLSLTFRDEGNIALNGDLWFDISEAMTK